MTVFSALPSASTRALEGQRCPERGGPHDLVTLSISLLSGDGLTLHRCLGCGDRSWAHRGRVLDHEQMLSLLAQDALSLKARAASLAVLRRALRQPKRPSTPPLQRSGDERAPSGLVVLP